MLCDVMFCWVEGVCNLRSIRRDRGGGWARRDGMERWRCEGEDKDFGKEDGNRGWKMENGGWSMMEEW